jgi:hypothetical protein
MGKIKTYKIINDALNEESDDSNTSLNHRSNYQILANERRDSILELKTQIAKDYLDKNSPFECTSCQIKPCDLVYAPNKCTILDLEVDGVHFRDIPRVQKIIELTPERIKDLNLQYSFD